jgi:hypothetical protein
MSISPSSSAANFIETAAIPRRLYLGGVACNCSPLSFGGYRKPDGTRDKAYHAGLAVTYIAASIASSNWRNLPATPKPPGAYQHRRDLAKQSLPKLVTDEGYLLNRSIPRRRRARSLRAPSSTATRILRQPRRHLLPRRRRRSGEKSTRRSPPSRSFVRMM